MQGNLLVTRWLERGEIWDYCEKALTEREEMMGAAYQSDEPLPLWALNLYDVFVLYWEQARALDQMARGTLATQFNSCLSFTLETYAGASAESSVSVPLRVFEWDDRRELRDLVASTEFVKQELEKPGGVAGVLEYHITRLLRDRITTIRFPKRKTRTAPSTYRDIVLDTQLFTRLFPQLTEQRNVKAELVRLSPEGVLSQSIVTRLVQVLHGRGLEAKLLIPFPVLVESYRLLTGKEARHYLESLLLDLERPDWGFAIEFLPIDDELFPDFAEAVSINPSLGVVDLILIAYALHQNAVLATADQKLQAATSHWNRAHFDRQIELAPL